jgi:IclR helix-turn-helix domain
MAEKPRLETPGEEAKRRLQETATVKYEPPPSLFSENGPEPSGGSTPVEPGALGDVVAVFERWLELPDTVPVYATLGAVAANLLPGDPIWFVLVGPPASGKTEVLGALGRLPDVYPVAVLTQSSLLSGVPRKDHGAGAKGGLLREVGDFGIAVLKDLGSLLSMHNDSRAEVLAALREIYDGSWTRYVGTEGGRVLHWQGKLGFLAGCTPALDRHHAVIAAMGERFTLCRFPEATEKQAERALEHAGALGEGMRRELAEAVVSLFASERREPRVLGEQEKLELVRLATLTARARSAVDRDTYSREIEAVPGAEGPARLVITLERLLAGFDTLGADRDAAMGMVRRVAADCIPAIRRGVLKYLAGRSEPVSTTDVADAVELPTTTVRRALEDLTAYKLARREPQGQGKRDLWAITTWAKERLP